MADWKNNPFAKKYKAKNAKTNALHELKHAKVKVGQGELNILRMGNEK